MFCACIASRTDSIASIASVAPLCMYTNVNKFQLITAFLVLQRATAKTVIKGIYKKVI